MSKRAFPWLAQTGLVMALGFVATMFANPPDDKPPAGANAPGKLATNRVTSVTVYPNSALVTREVEVAEGTGTQELVVNPLPPTTVNSSLYTEGTDGIRVLTTRFRTRAILEDVREDVRKLEEELKQLGLAREKLEEEIKAIQGNAAMLTKMEQFMTVQTVQAAEKGNLNSESAIALSKHIKEQRLETARELVTAKQQLQANQEKAEFIQRKLTELAAGPAKTERDAVIVVEKTNAAAGKVRLNYLVDAVTWRPQYKFRAGKTPKDPVQVEYLAALSQHSGEDWSNVKLVLSTAQPMLNSAPPELQTLKVTVLPKASAPSVAHNPDIMQLEDQVKDLRSKAQKDLNDRKQSSGVGLVNTAAALDQSFELFNPEAAMKRGCALAVREGPSVSYHLNTALTLPSRNEEQMLEVTRLEMTPDYYYKAVPILTSHVYRLADLTNKSNYVLLPGDATMYNGSDFVGQMNMPLVAIGETFTAGFGVDPQLQVSRQMTDKTRTMQGANQLMRYEYRLLVSSFKTEKVRVQVWDRLPHAETESVGVNLVKSSPDLSQDAIYLREQRPTNLLRWDVAVEPTMSGEKALAINYEFKLELDKQMTLGDFRTAGTFAPAAPAPASAPALTAHPNPAPAPAPAAKSQLPAMSSTDLAEIKAQLARLSPEDRKLAEAQVFCAIDQESPLGSTGPIFKEVIKGQPVFLCCKGCVAEARAHPEETLTQWQKLMARVSGKK